MKLESIYLVIEIIGGLAAILIAFRRLSKSYKVWKVKSVERAAKEHANHKMIEKICHELSPNGGASIKDMIGKIEKDCQELKFWRRSMNELDTRAIFVSDKDGHTVWANAAYLRLTQRSLQQVMGNSWLNSIHPHFRHRVREEWQSAVSEGRNFEMEYDYIVDGKSVEVRCIAIWDSKHGHFGIVTPTFHNRR